MEGRRVGEICTPMQLKHLHTDTPRPPLGICTHTQIRTQSYNHTSCVASRGPKPEPLTRTPNPKPLNPNP